MELVEPRMNVAIFPASNMPVNINCFILSN